MTLKWPKMTIISALAAAQIPEIYFDAHIQNAEQLKTELFTDEGRFMIDTIRNGILGGGVTKDIIDTLEMVCDKCSNYEPKLSDVQNMLLFPDLSEDGEFNPYCQILENISKNGWSLKGFSGKYFQAFS